MQYQKNGNTLGKSIVQSAATIVQNNSTNTPYIVLRITTCTKVKKVAKNLQKSVDKGRSVWYTKQAVSVRGSVEKALEKVFKKN